MLHPSPPCHVLSPPFFLSCNKACDPAGVAVVCSQFVNTLSSLGGAVYGTDFSLFSGFEVLMSEPSAAASGGFTPFVLFPLSPLLYYFFFSAQ